MNLWVICRKLVLCWGRLQRFGDNPGDQQFVLDHVASVSQRALQPGCTAVGDTEVEGFQHPEMEGWQRVGATLGAAGGAEGSQHPGAASPLVAKGQEQGLRPSPRGGKRNWRNRALGSVRNGSALVRTGRPREADRLRPDGSSGPLCVLPCGQARVPAVRSEASNPYVFGGDEGRRGY